MSKKFNVPFLKAFISKGFAIVAVLVGSIVLYSVTVEAKVCFLPGGICPGELTSGSVKATQGDQCIGYNLTQIKCKGQACEEGWDCESCTNAQGTFYKCNKKEVPDAGECGGDPNKDWTPGLEECANPCEHYDYCGFSGNKINGKCTPIPNYTAVDPGDCYSYIMPDYMYKVNISGADVTEEGRNNCYTNIVKMDGYTISKPASCTIYTSKLDGLGKKGRDTMCYTAGVPIGDYYSTTARDNTVFEVDTRYGVDTYIDSDGSRTETETEACYKAVGCNSGNGWLPADEIDGEIFEYSQESSDGITCRKAIACNENKQWFNSDKVGQYKDIYFATQEVTKSGITCYNATGCHNRAYTEQPDARYFKFDKKNSNNFDCWVVTGKSDNAYGDDEKESNYFSYDDGKEAYLNGTDETIKSYLVYGCSQYAYDSQPDSRYFTHDSLVQKRGGTNTNLTCWIITGKAEYAYNDNEKKEGFFKYDDGKEGYVNGTSSTVKYYNVASCNTPYAYTSEPDAKYFSFVKETQKKGGVNTDLTCWNITGKGQFAYAENEKNTKFFAYDAGKEGYLNGTSNIGKYYNITSCGIYAYPSQPDEICYSYTSQSGKKGGADVDLTCWNVSGKGQYAYTEGERKLNYFDYNACTAMYIDGTSTRETFYKMSKCMQYAYDAQPDDKYFSHNNETQYKDGTAEQKTCWNITGKGQYAYTEAEKKPLYFTYDSGKEGYIDGTSTKGKYFNATGRAEGTSDSSPDANIFNVNKEEAYKGGVNEVISAWRATACNAANHYTLTKPNVVYFTFTDASSTGITCYVATGCTSNGSPTNPGNCKTFSKQSNGVVDCYYNISTTGAGDCTTNKPSVTNGSCHVFSVGTDSNGNTVYYNIGMASAKPETSESQNCTESQGCSESAGCGCGGTQTRSGTQTRAGIQSRSRSVACNTNGSGWDVGNWSGWSGCSGSGGWSSCSYGGWSGCSGSGCSSGYTCVNGSCKVNSYNDGSQSCGCGGSKTKTCTLNGSGTYSCSWGGCSGEKDYEVDSESASCGCGGTKSRKKLCMSGWQEWSACSKEDCKSGETCDNGTCVKGCTRRPTSCPEPTCSDFGKENVTALGAEYGYQVMGFTQNCYNSCGIANVMPPTHCPDGYIYLIRCCY